MGVLRQIEWMGDSLEQLRTFPEEVKDEIGFALTLAQQGFKHDEAKPFNIVPKGMEIVSDLTVILGVESILYISRAGFTF